MVRKILPLLAVLLLAACSQIDESERLVYVKPPQVSRAVLLEDFTGQRCPNCPRGTDVIEQLQEEFGDSVVVAVGIHGGPLAFAGNSRQVGLATEVGNLYYDYWGLQYQPVGLVNRHGAVNYPDWTARVAEELSRPATLSLDASAVVRDGAVDISVRAMGTDGPTVGSLQVWLLEDSITAMQLMPDGTANGAYIHNHVLRTPVNGNWGQDFSIQEGQTQSVALSQPLADDWNPARLSIVAFVWNTSGVQQVVRRRVAN